jgi:archaellum biogenesis ATPase FlaH
MTKQNADYGYDIQKLYLELMLSDAETFVRCQSIFDHELFDRRLQTTAKFINDYVVEHNVLPTYEIVNAATKSDFVKPDDLREEHYDWLLQDFETFIKHKGLERAILASADLLEKGEYGPVEDLIKKAVQIGLQKDMGTNYYEDPRSRLMRIKDKNGQISTGWKALDQKLFGGFNRGELNIFAGGSGAGKSLFLANLGLNWSLAGLNVVYLTLELAEELVSMRLDSMVTDIPTREIFKQIDDIEMKVRVIGKKSGQFQIKYMPSGKTTNDIRSFMKEYEIKTGKRIDILLVDYLDLLMPISRKISAENLFIKDKFVSEELRNLAVEKNVILVTAAQLNRSAVEEISFDHSHISGGLSKVQTADNVFGIFTSRSWREKGRYQIQLLKTRSSSGVGQSIDLEFDIDTLRIRDLEDGEVPEYKGGQTVLENIRQRSMTTQRDDPTQGVSVKSSQVQVASTKLRDLLNNLNTEDI